MEPAPIMMQQHPRHQQHRLRRPFRAQIVMANSLSAISMAVIVVGTMTMTPQQHVASFLLGPSNRGRKAWAPLREHPSSSSSQTPLVPMTPEQTATYRELHEEILTIAHELWEGEEIPGLSSLSTESANDDNDATAPPVLREGEAAFPATDSFWDRGDYFRAEAHKGCPKAQHSWGLLLWSGYVDVDRDPTESAKFHAAAACQHHLDGMAVLGGYLRTGTGIPKPKKQKKQEKKQPKSSPKPRTNRVVLGLKLIDFCASVGNPTGINQQAALLESNGNEARAVELYTACWKSGRANALVLFNLGFCLVRQRGLSGFGDDTNHPETSSNTTAMRERGIALWKEATTLAPDEGSEEAAWNLYFEYFDTDPTEAQHWSNLVDDLGYVW